MAHAHSGQIMTLKGKCAAFAYAHLPEHLQSVSVPFSRLAELIVGTLPRNPERTVALRKLLEAKDAAVRAQIAKDQ